MTMVQGGKAVETRVRKFKINDLDQVLALAERYASWDATLTKADIEGFHSGSPEFLFVAEADKKILGFLCGRESNPPAETLDKWKSRKVASIETLAVGRELQAARNRHIIADSNIRSLQGERDRSSNLIRSSRGGGGDQVVWKNWI